MSELKILDNKLNIVLLDPFSMENRQINVKIRTFQYQFTHSNARYPTSYLISDLELCANSENQSQK